MIYRSGTYIAFHANNEEQPTESDMKYYNLLKAWSENNKFDLEFVDSHEKSVAARNPSTKAGLERALKQRLDRSKHMLLIIGKTTKLDTDWVPFEIRYAVDVCQIPIIAVYPDYEYVLDVEAKRDLWPADLKSRIDGGTARVIHIPFKEKPICDAVSQFDHDNPPKTGKNYYTKDAYVGWGIIK
jgi:hypothetical protein